MKAPRLSLMDILYIGLGGMLGSLLRSWVSFGFEGAFPVPTILVNILGTCALAVLHATQHRIHAHGRYLYMVGFCGSFTTVSLFSFETLELVHAGAYMLALFNIAVPVGCALLLASLIVSRIDRGEASQQ